MTLTFYQCKKCKRVMSESELEAHLEAEPEHGTWRSFTERKELGGTK